MIKPGKQLDGRDFAPDIICLKEKRKTYEEIIKDMTNEEKKTFNELCKKHNIDVTNKEKYYKELQKELTKFFNYHNNFIWGMNEEEEHKYIVENKLNDKIKNIYDKLKKEYNIK